MRDTSPEVERMIEERYAAMSGTERFMIGARMFDTARSIVLASLPADLSPLERRRALCRRLYPELGEIPSLDRAITRCAQTQAAPHNQT